MTRPRLDGLFRSSISLMATTGLTSALGLAFWAAASHSYSPEAVGRASATISAATLLGVLAQLNLAAVLIRFLPGAGTASAAFVRRAYVGTGTLALLLSLGYLLIGFGDGYLGQSLTWKALFVMAAVLLLLIGLQDAVLTAIGRAPLVLATNLAVSMAKLGLLVLAAGALHSAGIVAAWVVPLLLAVAVTSSFVFKRALPEHVARASGPSSLPAARQLSSFVAAEYVKSLLSTGTTLVLPLLVAARLGLAETAYFQIPWLVGSSALLLLNNLSSSFVVESELTNDRAGRLLRHMILMGCGLVVLCATLGYVMAPWLLSLAGPGYAEEGSTLLRLLFLSYPFSAVSGLYATFAWVEQRLWRLVTLQALNGVLLVGGSLLLLGEMGVSGVGVSFLVAQGVLALGSVPPIVRRLRARRAGVPAHPVRAERTTSNGQPALKEPDGGALASTSPEMAGTRG